MKVAAMTLHTAGPIRCLAGHTADAEAVYVLRKAAEGEYELHLLPVDQQSQELRVFLSSDQSIAGELSRSIAETLKKGAVRSKRRSKKSKRKTDPRASE